MTSLSRRSALRLAAGAGGAVGLLGAGAVTATGASPGVRVELSSTEVAVGETLTVWVSADLAAIRRVLVLDTMSTVWVPGQVVARAPQVWTGVPTQPGAAQVVVMTERYGGVWYVDFFDYSVTGVALGAALIGMSAMPDEWSQKAAEVGPGISARRIFADLASGPTNQIKLVEEAHAAGMLPVISYKVGSDVSGAIAGRFDAAAEQAADALASYGLPTAVTIWHEPYTDMTGAQFAAMHRQLMPIFKRDELRVGPILNGWLLDNQVSTFETFCPDDLFEVWDWFGIDTYEAGSMSDPGKVKPGDRITALSAYLVSRGYDLPIGVGEYNGHTAETIAAAGEALLTTPNVWFGCLWNVTGGVGVELSGDRLDAFRATVADPRAGSPLTT
ncbi:hypothetical protein [Nocardioides sp. P5_C9_2]